MAVGCVILVPTAAIGAWVQFAAFRLQYLEHALFLCVPIPRGASTTYTTPRYYILCPFPRPDARLEPQHYVRSMAWRPSPSLFHQVSSQPVLVLFNASRRPPVSPARSHAPTQLLLGLAGVPPEAPGSHGGRSGACHGRACRCLPQHPYRVSRVGHDRLQIRRTWPGRIATPSRCMAGAPTWCLGMTPCLCRPSQREIMNT